ncbi:MAG: hypothetical protein HKN48_00020, partial [Flavobacteriaceae bacterium]|nr:hypothetical protein [Flavobacteriaceae bacterium]
LFTPYLAGKNEDVAYKQELWYPHKTGESMLNFLPGNLTSSWNEDIEYYTPFISHFYEIAEEAKQAFSDDKVVRTRASFPIPIVRKTKCYECGGDKKKLDGQGKKTITCNTCDETGHVYLPGPTGVYFEDDSGPGFMDEGGTSKSVKDPIRWAEPNLAYPKQSYEVAWDLYDKCEKSLWLDVIDGAGANASEEAILQRRKDFLDAQHYNAVKLYTFWDRFLWHCECTLNRRMESQTKDNRIKPTHIIPDELRVKSAEELAQEAKMAAPENRLSAKLEEYRKKYKDSPIELRKHEILLCYSIVYLSDNDEIQTLLAKDILSKDDILKSKFAPVVLKDIAKEPNFLEYKDEKVFDLIDKALLDRYGIGAEKEENPKEVDLDTDTTKESIKSIKDAIKSESMSESEAISLAMKLFKIDEEKAAELLELNLIE